MLLDARVDVGEGADGARDGGGRDFLAGRVQTAPRRKNADFTPPSGPSIAGKPYGCIPSGASRIQIGCRSGANGSTPDDGWNQYMTCRSTVIGTPRSASSSGAHAPGHKKGPRRGWSLLGRDGTLELLRMQHKKSEGLAASPTVARMGVPVKDAESRR